MKTEGGKVVLEEMGWNEYFMGIAESVSRKSKDSTKVGAVIVGKKNEIVSTGYNGFPRGIKDGPDQVERYIEHKYKWTEHAERNAIYNACLDGKKLEGTRIYISNYLPCMDCARAIIQCGIEAVFVWKQEPTEYWKWECDNAFLMLQEAGVRYVKMDRPASQ